MAFVYDAQGRFAERANPDTITWAPVRSTHWAGVLRRLVEAHAAATDSRWSRGLLDEWERALPRFVQVVPKEMLARLDYPLDDSDAALVEEAVAAE
jgi:glutamate synthase (NADPH) large chain